MKVGVVRLRKMKSMKSIRVGKKVKAEMIVGPGMRLPIGQRRDQEVEKKSLYLMIILHLHLMVVVILILVKKKGIGKEVEKMGGKRIRKVVEGTFQNLIWLVSFCAIFLI